MQYLACFVLLLLYPLSLEWIDVLPKSHLSIMMITKQTNQLVFIRSCYYVKVNETCCVLQNDKWVVAQRFHVTCYLKKTYKHTRYSRSYILHFQIYSILFYNMLLWYKFQKKMPRSVRICVSFKIDYKPNFSLCRMQKDTYILL